MYHFFHVYSNQGHGIYPLYRKLSATWRVCSFSICYSSHHEYHYFHVTTQAHTQLFASFLCIYSQHITIPEIKGDKLPPLRLGQHAACCLRLSADNPHLLVSGGRLSVRMQPPLKDMWLLNLTSWTWQEVSS